MDIRRIIDHPGTRAGRVFTAAIQTLIVLSLVSFSIETLPDLDGSTRTALHAFEVFTVAVFSLEYVLRLWAAPSKFRYVLSFFGLVDLFAILPFYLSTGIDLRAIRALRMFRLLRLFKLVRYSRALNRFRRALADVKEELILYAAGTAILLFLAAVGIYYFEREQNAKMFGSVFHCLWWAVATFTTVGYGDLYPVTVGGKVFTFFMLILGLGIIAVPPGIIASALTKSKNEEVQAGDTDEQSSEPEDIGCETGSRQQASRSTHAHSTHE